MSLLEITGEPVRNFDCSEDISEYTIEVNEKTTSVATTIFDVIAKLFSMIAEAIASLGSQRESVLSLDHDSSL